MIEIKFQAATAKELQEKILGMATLFVPSSIPVAPPISAREIQERMEEKKVTPVAMVQHPAEAPAPEVKKGRPKKEKAPEPEAEEQDIINTSELKSGGATQTDVVDALKKVNTTKGMAAARKIMTDLGYNKIAEIQEQHYEAIVEACEKLLGKAAVA